MTVKCDYCQQPAEMVSGDVIYPHRADLADLNFWRCVPCNAYVGCHKYNPRHGNTGIEPLGRLANAELRAAKSAAHRAFDPLWKSGQMSRADAYAWLAERLSVPPIQCHIGMFDVSTCHQVVEACRASTLDEDFS